MRLNCLIKIFFLWKIFLQKVINKIKQSLRNWPQKQAKMLDQALEEMETLHTPSQNKQTTNNNNNQSFTKDD